MTRVVRHVEEDPGGEAIRKVLDDGPAAVGTRTPLGGEAGGVGSHLGDVGVPAQHPEPDPVGRVRARLLPPARSLRPQGGEDVVGKAVGEQVEVAQVDQGEVDGGQGHRVSRAARGPSGASTVGHGWVMSSGRTLRSNSSALRYPRARAASRREVPSW